MPKVHAYAARTRKAVTSGGSDYGRSLIEIGDSWGEPLLIV